MRVVRPDSESRGVDDGAVQIDLADGRVTLHGETLRLGLVTLGRAVDFIQLDPSTRSFSVTWLRGPGVVVILPASHANSCLKVSAARDLGQAVPAALVAIEGPLGREYPDARVAVLSTATLGEAERIAWATLATFAIEAANAPAVAARARALAESLRIVALAAGQHENPASVARDEPARPVVRQSPSWWRAAQPLP